MQPPPRPTPRLPDRRPQRRGRSVPGARACRRKGETKRHMAETAPQDRLQPFLLQRLKDDQPDARQESPERPVISPAEYRRTLLEDLTALLNSGNHVPAEQLARHPEAAKSVINFGVTELAGTTASGKTGDLVAKMVQNAIALFEPRV